MRIRKDAIRGRLKGDLPIVFTDEKLSAYGGIELFRRFLDRSGFSERLQKVFSIRQFDGDYPVFFSGASGRKIEQSLSAPFPGQLSTSFRKARRFRLKNERGAAPHATPSSN